MPDVSAIQVTRPSDILRMMQQLIPCLAQPRRPLAIGIGPQLRDRIVLLTGCDPRTAGIVIGMHCTAAAYFRAVVEGATRVDIDGNPAGIVTAEEAAHAANRLPAAEAAEARRRAVSQAARSASAELQKSSPMPVQQPAGRPRVNPLTGRRILSIGGNRASA